MILIVDDDVGMRLLLSKILERNGFATVEAHDGRQAIEKVQTASVSTVLLDLKMPGLSGTETIQEIKRIAPDLPVVVVSATSDVSTVVELMKLGAYDYVIKPDFERLPLIVKRATEKYALAAEVRSLHFAVDSSLERVAGTSRIAAGIIGQISRVASSDLSVVIQGETGTGKSFVARAIHDLGRRKHKPFLTVDIGAIPESLLESELFGYERGAFTGAEKKRAGYFEIANGGTMLLDEIQNMSSYVQGKLLGVADGRGIYPLGTSTPIEVDVRLIAATNRDIKQDVAEGKFREDLYFRLSEFMITLPPLRERPEDILFFAHRFLTDAVLEMEKHVVKISDAAEEKIRRYKWPGNLRELKNVLRRAVLLCDGPFIEPEHISLLNAQGGSERGFSQHTFKNAIVEAEISAISSALRAAGGNKSKAASALRLNYKTLLSKINKYGIR